MAALIFTAIEFRGKRKEQHFRNYLDGIKGFIDDSRFFLENSDLHALYTYSPDEITATYEELSEVQRRRALFCDIIIARCETIWVAADEGWVAKDEWKYWQTWLRELAGSSEFRWAVNWLADDYDSAFIDLLRDEIRAVQQAHVSDAQQTHEANAGATSAKNSPSGRA